MTGSVESPKYRSQIIFIDFISPPLNEIPDVGIYQLIKPSSAWVSDKHKFICKCVYIDISITIYMPELVIIFVHMCEQYYKYIVFD